LPREGGSARASNGDAERLPTTTMGSSTTCMGSTCGAFCGDAISSRVSDAVDIIFAWTKAETPTAIAAAARNGQNHFIASLRFIALSFRRGALQRTPGPA
jgi:hypothetical protein